MNTVYDFIYTLITGFFLPAENVNVDWWSNLITIVCVVVSILIFYVAMIRPFIYFLKYGMFGNSKKNKLLNWNKDD